jgi:hypothetical protein
VALAVAALGTATRGRTTLVQRQKNLLPRLSPEERTRWQPLRSEVRTAGLTIIEVGKLARIKGLEQRTKLTPTQSNLLAASLESLAIGIEPDSRFTHRAYGWNDSVAVFQPAGAPKDRRYPGAALLLTLCFYVAAAGGEVSDADTERITQQLGGRIQLNPNDRFRLTALSRVLRFRRPTLAGMAKRLQTHIPSAVRESVGRLIVSLAAHDGVILPKEITALRSAYKALGLEPAILDQLLADAAPAPDASNDATRVALPATTVTSAASALMTPNLQLDEGRLRQILSETQDVARLLGETLSEEDSTEDEAEDTAPLEASEKRLPAISAPPLSTDARFASLELRYRAALAELLTRPDWPKSDFDMLARRFELMPSRLFDALNEWAIDTFGDMLVEEQGEEILIHNGLITDTR